MRLARNGCIRKSGFTLIELMVVLVLIGIMTAMIIPEMKGSYEDALLRSNSRELVNVLNLAYSRAVTINQPHRVRLDRSAGRYLIERRVGQANRENSFTPVKDIPGGEGRIDPRISIEFRIQGEDFSNASDQNPPLVSRDDLPPQDRVETIAFYPDGTADAREILLEDRAGFRLALRINPTTARVEIVELERK
jgi:type II secretion system protein H